MMKRMKRLKKGLKREINYYFNYINEGIMNNRNKQEREFQFEIMSII